MSAEPEVFLKGERVSLCIPDVERDVLNGNWHSWFNDLSTTRFLEHGVRPVSRQQEAAIVQGSLDNPKTFMLTINAADTLELCGVISLANINQHMGNAEIALVTSGIPRSGGALEAMALMTTHAFERFNLAKIYAGQHEGLWKWVNSLKLIGYDVEGLRREQNCRDGRRYDVILTGITGTRYYALKDQRGGSLLGDDIDALMAKRSKVDFVPGLRSALEGFGTDHDPQPD
jgi:RimJ/RimL family protein N-acetyltransferase